MRLVLHDYWRSGAAYRVRIALNLKGLAFERRVVDLRAGAQAGRDYLALNPQGLVPVLEADGVVLTQSGAILEWLEETFPAPPLLPPDARSRAVVRAMADIVGRDIHPLNNLRVQKELRGPLGVSEGQVSAWIARWVTAGFTALEALIAQHGGAFAFGDAPTLADCHLVPQVYSARRFEVDLEGFPHIRRVEAAAAALAAFAAAHPNAQADAEPGQG
jgi:maleylpyruvate isomerase